MQLRNYEYNDSLTAFISNFCIKWIDYWAEPGHLEATDHCNDVSGLSITPVHCIKMGRKLGFIEKQKKVHQASTLTAGPLARQVFSPSLASRASGSSSPLARKGQWPSVRTTRCSFCAGPKRKSDLRIKSKTMRKSDLSRRIHLFSVIRPTPFISGFPSLGHPSPDSGKQQWLYPALSDRRVCVTETGSWKASASAVSVNDTNVHARKFCRPRRPIVARGRGDWLSERGLFRIRFRNASLLLMLRLAKMFEKLSKHMEGNYWAPPDTSV